MRLTPVKAEKTVRKVIKQKEKGRLSVFFTE